MQWLYQRLRRTRPAAFAALLKELLGIQRQVVTTREGDRLWIDPVSHFGGEVLETGSYEPDLTRLLEVVLRPGDVFLDVGANEGYFSVVASRLVGPQGKVISVEPQSRLGPVVERNLSMRSQPRANVHVVRAACGEAEGEVELHLTPTINTGASSVYRHWKVGGSVEWVPQRRLDALVRELGCTRIRFIKLDCEGAEVAILKGAESLFQGGYVDFVSVEPHPQIVGKNVQNVIDGFLRDCGMKLHRTANAQWLYHLPGLERDLLPVGDPTEIPPLTAAPLG